MRAFGLNSHLRGSGPVLQPTLLLRTVTKQQILLRAGDSTMRLPKIVGALLGGAGLLGPAVASAAPAELLNRTVTVSYSTAIPAKGSDGSTRTATRSSVRIIYISSAGRIFTRLTRRDSGTTDTKDTAPENPKNNLHFEGNKLVGVMTFATGAALMTISFEGGGQSCSAELVSGRDKGAFRFKGLNGVMYEATGPATFSGVSCSIASGNAFGGQ
jgi:hypothetical protein